MNPENESRFGLICTLAAFTLWGLIPVYIRMLSHISVWEITAHRAAGVVILGTLILWATRSLHHLVDIFRSPKLLAALALSAFFIGVNWVIFTWAVANERVLDTSMGYFINPLFYVVLGVVVLRERLSKMQAVSVAIAAFGVAYLIVKSGDLPWIALALPFSFGFYGLIRKKTPVHALAGLLTEAIVFAPLAFGYIIVIAMNGTDHVVNGSWSRDWWLMFAGVVTIMPLTLFSTGARRVSLTVVGFIQYLAPSMTFLMAIFLFKEEYTQAKMVTFVCIWISLAIFTIDGILEARKGRADAIPTSAEALEDMG